MHRRWTNFKLNELRDNKLGVALIEAGAVIAARWRVGNKDRLGIDGRITGKLDILQTEARNLMLKTPSRVAVGSREATARST